MFSHNELNTGTCKSLRISELFTVIRQVAPLNCAPEGWSCYRRLPCYGRRMEQGRPFLPCGFYIFFLLSFFLHFSSPNVSSRRLGVYHRPTSTHHVALVRNANLEYRTCLKCAARGSLKYRTQKLRPKSPSAHHHTTLSGYILICNNR